MQSKTDIGFGKKIRLEWLDSALGHAAAGHSFEEAKEALAREIAAHNSGVEAIRKVQTALKRVWFTPPAYCSMLRNDALRLYAHNDTQATRMLLHWGMCIAAYPFVGTVAETIGRLLKLQKEAHISHVLRRVSEQHGDRAFVKRIAQYNLSSFLDWGVLMETKQRGVYKEKMSIRPENCEQAAWLIEALLIAVDRAQVQYSELPSHPVLFPVSLQILNTATLKCNPRLRIERQGFNQDVVFLETSGYASLHKGT